MLGSWRATPTTEIEAGALQPYDGIVHNGTIANDVELGRRPGEIDSQVLPRVLERGSLDAFTESIGRLRGSYAIGCLTDRTIYLATNYKPIYWARFAFGTTYFSSMARHLEAILPPGHGPVAVEPYSTMDLSTLETRSLARRWAPTALVIASAGLDSTVVATKLIRDGYRVRLLHFSYGCAAESREIAAIPKIAEALGCEHAIVPLDYTHLRGGSPLLDPERYNAPGGIAGGIAGAEFGYEWVPARNLLMLAWTTAYAEANGFHLIVLGNNLEEAGAYPDNEEEFTTRFAGLLPYAVRDGYRVDLAAPVGNLMKHEIVRLGLDLEAPLHLTWSCYRGGERHCGECGPCFMRRTAFERNGAADPVFAETRVEVAI